MQETFRTHMGWLHSWLGLCTGLIFICIFATGTLSVFDTEITHWMQPEVPLNAPATVTAKALDQAAQVLQNETDKGYFPFIMLPSTRDPVMRILHYEGHVYTGPTLNPTDGQIIPARQTVGGHLFFNFHFTLYSGVFVGSTLVCVLGLFLLVGLGSGVAIHIKTLWPNLLVLRPFGARPRAWLDAHLLVGVLFLPFLIMITYTGTVILARAVFPSHAIIFHHETNAPPPLSQPEHSQTRPFPLPPLFPLLEQAKAHLHTNASPYILLSADDITFAKNYQDNVFDGQEMAVFNRHNGQFRQLVFQPTRASKARELVQGLHYAHFNAPLLCWLYFISGLACTGMMAAGVILFFLKRRKNSATRFLFRLGEGLTISTITGLIMAILSLFLANRLLPATLPNRITAETTSFFTIWALCAAHAIACSLQHKPLMGWRVQSRLIAALAFTLPVIDALLAQQGWAQAKPLYGTIAGISIFSGLCALYAVFKLKEKIA